MLWSNEYFGRGPAAYSNIAAIEALCSNVKKTDAALMLRFRSFQSKMTNTVDTAFI